jgi:hypothetical protein
MIVEEVRGGRFLIAINSIGSPSAIVVPYKKKDGQLTPVLFLF